MPSYFSVGLLLFVLGVGVASGQFRSGSSPRPGVHPEEQAEIDRRVKRAQLRGSSRYMFGQSIVGCAVGIVLILGGDVWFGVVVVTVVIACWLVFERIVRRRRETA